MKQKYNSRELLRYILLLLIGIPIFLLTDSPAGDALFGNGQYAANLLVFLAFIRAYRSATSRSRYVLLIGMLVGLTGEFLFSKVLGMYHYRLDNIPLWLAFAHGLIFAWVYKVSRNKSLRKHQKTLQIILLIGGMSYSVIWFFWVNDVFGLMTAAAFLLILPTVKKSRLFFLIMFAVVCYIEQIGTATGCWYWPETTLHMVNGLASGNPPSGIGVFYFLFDAAVFWIYLYILHPTTRLRYQRLRNISKA